MSKAFKAFFLDRQLREKLLLLVFIAAGVAVWLSSFSGRARRFWVEAKSANATLATQADWLSRSDAIEARSKVAIGKLDPSRTYTVGGLFSELDRLGREYFSSRPPQVTTDPSQRSGQFAINSATMSITASNTEADWQSLRKLYLDLQKKSPYITLKGLLIRTQAAGRPGAGGAMTVTLRASSIEVVQPAR